MAYHFYNPNPKNKRVGDCSVRACCKALGRNWEDTYISLCSEGLALHDMPSANYVWGMYLHKFGFTQKNIASVCPDCITVAEFAEEHPFGRYVLACQGHVVCVADGEYFDSWDSGGEVVLYYWEKEV